MSEELSFENYTFGVEIDPKPNKKKNQGVRKFSENIYNDEKRGNQAGGIRKMSCEPSDFKVKYKTEYCKYWKLQGNCPFYQQCAFAHGNDEIRHKTHLPQNYKTKRCKNFFENGYCSYGQRCQFVHVNGDIFSETSAENQDLKSQIIQELPEQSTNADKSPLKYEQQLDKLDMYWNQNTLSFQTPKLLNRPRLATFESIASSSPENNQNQNCQPQVHNFPVFQSYNYIDEKLILELQENSSSDKSTALNSQQNSDQTENLVAKKRKQSKGFNVNAKEFDIQFGQSESPITSQTTNNPESIEDLQI